MQELIQSLPNDLADGPDVLHLQHLIGTAAGKSGRDLLCALCEFYPPRIHSTLHIRPPFFDAELIALQKREEGIQPIAVGLLYTLHRLVANVPSFTIAIL